MTLLVRERFGSDLVDGEMMRARLSALIRRVASDR